MKIYLTTPCYVDRSPSGDFDYLKLDIGIYGESTLTYEQMKSRVDLGFAVWYDDFNDKPKHPSFLGAHHHPDTID